MRLGIRFTLFLVAVVAITTSAAEPTVFDGIFDQYESIRQVLIEDSTDGIAAHAAAIATAADGLEGDFSPGEAGVGPKDGETVERLLPEIVERANKLASAKGLEATRNEFAELTKPLVRWQHVIEGPRPMVAYCPMVKKAWLQPDEAISNPYAPSMLRCGEVVQR